MVDDIKRVGLVFQADGIVDFKKSLKEVNSSIQENRSAFKLTQSQWDENTKSADKLRDRQRYLAEQTKDYSDKVKLLEEELAELQSAEEKDYNAINKKTNQLNTAKLSLNNYQKALGEVEKEIKSGKAQLEDYVESLEKMGEKATSAGETLTKSLTAGVTAVGAAAIASAVELDEGYDIIITKTGATGDELQDLYDVADEVFSGMAVEMSDVGIAIGEVNTRFGSTGDELQNVTENFLKFAEINEVDVNNSIDTVDKIMTQFKIDSSKTSDVLGILTKRSQETGIATDTLMNSVSSNSSTFIELGFSLEESINLLSKFEANGVDSSTAMMGLKKSITNMADEGLSADETLGKLISSIQNAKTDTEALNIATEIFGTKGAVEMTAAIRDGRFSMDDLSDSIENYSDTVQTTYEETLDPWDQLTVATNNLKVAGADLANEIFEVVAPMLEDLCGVVEKATDWFGSLDDDEKQQIVTIALVVAAIGPLLTMFGKMTSGIGSIITTLGKLPGMLTTVGSGFSKVWGIMSANPVLMIITIITSLIVLFVTLYNKCDWFREGVDKIWGSIKSTLSGFKDWLIGLFDFEWKLPQIKLPHFYISGEFSLKPPSVPTFGVSWYANGGILNNPTIFGMNGNTLLGGGEAGQEAVLPIELLRQYIREENVANNSILVGAIKEAFSELSIVAENNIFIGSAKIDTTLTEMVIQKITDKMNAKMRSQGVKV